jgi:assimilatory nitrate reductase catalytic subunit
MATNPAVSLPDAGNVRAALEKCPFVVVSDVIANTDTTAYADVRLPAAAWGEKDGTVTNSERTISRQRPFMDLPGEAKPDWWIVKEVGRRMGWGSTFAYDTPADIWREHARLTAYQNDGARVLNLAAHAAIGNLAYDAMEPFRWGGTPFADGRFPTPSGRARMVKVGQMELQAPLADWPLTLNTGRYRDQWHTMTRTGLAPKLARHREEPLVEVHPADALALDLKDGDLARVSTPQGNSTFRVQLSDGQRPGEIFTPIHWTDQISTGGRTGLLPRPLVDPPPPRSPKSRPNGRASSSCAARNPPACPACGRRAWRCRAARSTRSRAMAMPRASKPACPRASASRPSTIPEARAASR